MVNFNFDYIKNDLKKYFLFFLFFNILGFLMIILVQISYPGSGLQLNLFDFAKYGTFFITETIWLIAGVLLGLGFSMLIIFIQPITSRFYDLISNFLVQSIILISPLIIFIIALSGGNILIYDVSDGNLGFSLFLFEIYVISIYIFVIIMREIKAYRYLSSQELTENTIELPIIIVKKKLGSIFNLLIFIIPAMNLPFVARELIISLFRFSTNTLFYSNDPLLTTLMINDFYAALILISVQILIVGVIFSLIHFFVGSKTKMTSFEILRNMQIPEDQRYSLPEKILIGIIAVLTIIIGYANLYFKAVNLTSFGILSHFLIFHNPDYFNIYYRNLPPNNRFWFGTDSNGRDIFSRTMLSLPALVGRGFLVLILALVFVWLFNFLTKKMEKQKKMDILDFLNQIPSLAIIIIPILVLDAFIPLGIITRNVYIYLIIFLFSLIIWPELAYTMEKNPSKNQSMIDYLINRVNMRFLGSFIFLQLLLRSNSFDQSFGSTGNFTTIVGDAIFNFPQTYWWGWFYPLLVFILLVSVFRSSRVST